MSNFKYVNLGLPSGTLWATENLPGYYAFGELEEKLSYTLDNSITFDKTKVLLMKEGLCDSSGTVISKHSYTIPTKEQFLELMTVCDWKWDPKKYGYEVSHSFVENGYYVTRSIFLPTEGYQLKTDIVDKDIWGNYWTSSIIDGKYHAAYLYFFKNAIYWGNHSERFYGRSVRPVLNTKCKSTLDLELPSGNLWDSCDFGADSVLSEGKLLAFGEDDSKSTYTMDNWKFAVWDTDRTKWYKRYRSDIVPRTLRDEFTEIVNGTSVTYPQCLDRDNNWIDNTTDLVEPSKNDYEELINNKVLTEEIYSNNIKYRIIYFKNNEVLLFREDSLSFKEDKNRLVFWTKTTKVVEAEESQAYTFNPIVLNVQDTRDLITGQYLRRIKKQ